MTHRPPLYEAQLNHLITTVLPQGEIQLESTRHTEKPLVGEIDETRDPVAVLSKKTLPDTILTVTFRTVAASPVPCPRTYLSNHQLTIGMQILCRHLSVTIAYMECKCAPVSDSASIHPHTTFSAF